MPHRSALRIALSVLLLKVLLHLDDPSPRFARPFLDAPDSILRSQCVRSFNSPSDKQGVRGSMSVVGGVVEEQANKAERIRNARGPRL